MTAATTASAAAGSLPAPRTLWHALPRADALKAHASIVPASLFLAVYNQFVCPFMDGLPFLTLLEGLAVVMAVQIVLRQILWVYWPAPQSVSLARHGWRIAVISWGIAGLKAMTLHGLTYEAYPLLSYLKLATGFWILGAGLIAQFEYTLLEDMLRKRGAEGAAADESPGATARRLEERIVRRLTESASSFAVAPAAALVMMAVRQVEEGYAEPVIVVEVLFIAAVFVGAALLVAGHYGRSLRRDTVAIVDSLDAVSGGRFDVCLDASRPDELGRVAGGINTMAAGLRQRERIRDAFGRFVSPEVAETVLAEAAEGAVRLHGERRHVAVLMCDLRDFTPLAERLEPEEVTALLNGYFAEMVAAVHAHHGMVDKFIGDAVMAVFGLAPCPQGRTPERLAVDAALEMRARLAAFNAAHPNRPPLSHGIGIHAGPAVAGTIGSPDRLEFTVIGSTVNLAARLEAETRAVGEPILMSEAVAAHLNGAARPVGTGSLKGLSRPVALFAPQAATPTPLLPSY
ncbi:Adenylate cyclase [Caenispirillum salinarum AK4]|uniref:Adenylate cyclase n=1 Tax=Caenispirillum salinarum AK4 TaxID=1238182 RepID=K9H2D8_9PROT|nr:adenylate/guanylate cyclase domain-containing protein [Caenispirillum salinarum]EKV32435.1 Adenylate cyclase [Caenispirillum salinarum AK4]